MSPYDAQKTAGGQIVLTKGSFASLSTQTSNVFAKIQIE